jgi:hypothetical protein
MNVNFKRLLLLLTPTFLRKGVIKSLLSAIAKAFQSVKKDIDSFYSDINYHVRVTPQLFSLEKMLNDKCDKLLRRIYIGTPHPGEPFYFTNVRADMKYFGGGDASQFFTGNSDYAYDFAVYLPHAIESEDMTNIVTALLNKYAIITKSFLIFYV